MNAHDPWYPEGCAAQWGGFALSEIGFDATLSEVLAYLPSDLPESSKPTSRSLEVQRQMLFEKNQHNPFLKEEARLRTAVSLVGNVDGRRALRTAMRALRPEELVEILDFRGND